MLEKGKGTEERVVERVKKPGHSQKKMKERARKTPENIIIMERVRL